MKRFPDILVFSDLDGTLLDHHTYSWTPAEEALARIRKDRVGLILASSKTQAEVASIRADLGFADWPAIVENGGGLLESDLAGGPVQRTLYADIRARLRGLPKGFVGFGDMTEHEVAKVTGLSLAAARRAKQRAFSEPGLWTGQPEGLSAFERSAKLAGLSLRHGGRFLTVSLGATKADQMEVLIKRFRPRLVLALGDAPNDIEMLEKADHGVIVANDVTPDLPPLPGEASGHITRTCLAGPAGWARAVTAFLDQYAPTEYGKTNG
ncbi:HAD hydrolase family protein [Shimia sp. SDUM112013]|uniref:HAD-IIB family hydrolase n=1 Tax=Shimia sp. SDUM112013 TaxID=3136160 RepID=UPI0032ED434E